MSMKPLEGKPILPRPIIRALNQVQNNQTYEAEFVTLSPRRPDGTTAPGPDNGVLVDLEPTRNGPPFLLVGADITAMTDNVSRGTLDLRLINNDLGGYRSELRTDLRIGFLTQASTEYYRLLRQNGLFVQPHAGLLRQPVYISAISIALQNGCSRMPAAGWTSAVPITRARSLRRNGVTKPCAGTRRAATTSVPISPEPRRRVCCTSPTTA